MSERSLHVVNLLIRENLPSGGAGFLIYPHENWHGPGGEPVLTLPAKKTRADPLASFLRGTPIDDFLAQILEGQYEVPAGSYALEQELEPVELIMRSPTHGVETHYVIYPIDLWLRPEARERLRLRVSGRWLGVDALAEPHLSPTARAVFVALKEREDRLELRYRDRPEEERRHEAPRRLLSGVADVASMDAQAKMWLAQNLRGVRHLPGKTLDAILDAGDRAFNLRVADPYLRYHMQGLGFTWSFFTHKDPQDCHVHGAPVVEIYGILEGRLEAWWKPYHDRGTSAWNHRILESGDWLEVDSLQCHIVRWLGPGKGVVFKAGPGPLAEVGKLGVKGKTPCKDCPCIKPPEVRDLEAARG